MERRGGPTGTSSAEGLDVALMGIFVSPCVAAR
jgi:hypothetical protein